MKLLGLMMILFASHSYAEESFITRIYSIESDLVKFQNARVAIAPLTLKIDAQPGELVKVTIVEKNQLVSMEKIEDLEIPNTINAPFVDETYRPSVLKNYASAQKMLDQMREDFMDKSASHHLAHIWAYEELKKSNHYSQKAFLFFSDAFIREHHHEWWFHVSPLMNYRRQHHIEEVILDKTLRKTPLSLAAWSAQLMGEKIHCPQVEKFSQTKMARDCSILKSNMYYWQPLDLELLEYEQLFRVNFFEFELEQALQAAFTSQFLPKKDLTLQFSTRY